MLSIKLVVCLCLLQLWAINSFSIKSTSFRPYYNIITSSSSGSSLLKSGLVLAKSRKQEDAEDAVIINAATMKTKSTIQEKMQQISNVASILCVVDCTVLPLVTVLLPVLGLSTITFGSTSTDSLLHNIGHAISLYFVIPVGSLTAIMNLISNNQKISGRKRRTMEASGIFLLSFMGLILVYITNSHHIPQPIMKPLSKVLPHRHLHALHSHKTMLHKTANTIGSGLLILSNYLSRRIFGCHHNDDHGGCIDHVH